MIELFKSSVTAQFEGALSMVRECVEKCPAEHWEGLIAKYPFWLVAYHTLYCTDLHLSREDVWRPRKEFHPGGRADVEEEYPSRRFEREELLKYTAFCRGLVLEAVAAETAETLAGPSGFARRAFPRAELYLYNLRHVQHHTGQLSAFLRKVGVETGWVGRGWVERGWVERVSR
jgi:uncharacterized damage-inducible protein DinB